MKPALALGVLALCAAAPATPKTPTWPASPTLVVRTTIRAIRFTGAEALGARELRGAMVSSEGSILSRDQLARDAESIVRLYYARGYYDAQAAPEPPSFTPDSSMADVTVAIREG